MLTHRERTLAGGTIVENEFFFKLKIIIQILVLFINDGRAKEFCKFFNGFSPVAQAVLLFSGHFGEGRFIPLWYEDGIISKPLFPARLPAYPSRGKSKKGFKPAPGKSQGQTAHEPRSPLFIGCLFQIEEKFFVILRVIP